MAELDTARLGGIESQNKQCCLRKALMTPHAPHVCIWHARKVPTSRLLGVTSNMLRRTCIVSELHELVLMSWHPSKQYRELTALRTGSGIS